MAGSIKPESVLKALKLWHGGEESEWPLKQLQIVTTLEQPEEKYSTLAGQGEAANNRAILEQGLRILAGTSPEASELLRLRFEHKQEVRAVANRLNIAESTIYYRQREAIKQLSEILANLEKQAGFDWENRMLSRLELPTYSELVGVSEQRTMLTQALQTPNQHFIAIVDGLGGLGKTALADQVARDLIESKHFQEIAWVTAKQTYISAMGHLQIEAGRPALTVPMLLDVLASQFEIEEQPNTLQILRQQTVEKKLQEEPCLIIIDNLETVADSNALLPQLREWQNPSRFLLTSRRRLLSEFGVLAVSLSELPKLDAFHLIRLESQRLGFLELSQASNDILEQIYGAVGGNPLAIKLLIGQLRFYSLNYVLSRFTNKTPDSNDGLFDYVYQETWERLNESEQDIMLALSTAGESGFSFEHLQAVTNSNEPNLRTILEKLVQISLVDIGGNLVQRRYRLHRLTTIFLQRLLA